MNVLMVFEMTHNSFSQALQKVLYVFIPLEWDDPF